MYETNGNTSNANDVINDDDIDGADDDKNDVLLVRIYGKNTEVLIDRKQEISNFKLLHSYGFAPKLLATFENGLVYEYCSGRPLTKDQLLVEHVWRGIARQMAEMHCRIECPNAIEPMLWTKFGSMIELIPATFSDPTKQAR